MDAQEAYGLAYDAGYRGGYEDGQKHAKAKVEQWKREAEDSLVRKLDNERLDNEVERLRALLKESRNAMKNFAMVAFQVSDQELREYNALVDDMTKALGGE